MMHVVLKTPSPDHSRRARLSLGIDKRCMGTPKRSNRSMPSIVLRSRQTPKDQAAYAARGSVTPKSGKTSREKSRRTSTSTASAATRASPLLGKRHGGSSAAAILGGGPTGKKQARKSAPTEGGNPHQFGGGNEENGKKRAENPAKMVEMKNEWLTSTEKGQMERRVSMEQMEKEEALGELSKSFEELDDFELIIAPATSTTSKGEGGKENAEATKADEPMME